MCESSLTTNHWALNRLHHKMHPVLHLEKDAFHLKEGWKALDGRSVHILQGDYFCNLFDYIWVLFESPAMLQKQILIQFSVFYLTLHALLNNVNQQVFITQHDIWYFQGFLYFSKGNFVFHILSCFSVDLNRSFDFYFKPLLCLLWDKEWLSSCYFKNFPPIYYYL